eukprot:GSMAST32.ASY1.ANO1.1252.1 assembled CDS
MMQAFGPRFSSWGIQVQRMELLDMRPKKGQTFEMMKKQMIAERNRRAEFIIAEGNKAAVRLRSEGTKRVKLNLGLAEQESLRKRSEGERDSKIEIARAESQSLDTIAQAITGGNCSQTDYVSQRYIDLFRDVLSRVKRKTLYFPYLASGISGLVGHLPKVFGADAKPKTIPIKRKKDATGSSGEFSDLS